MKQIVTNSLIKNGLYAGAILAGYFLLLYLFSVNFFSMGLPSFLVQAVVVIIFMFLGIAQARKQTENKVIKIGPALLLSVGIMFMALLCYAVMELFIVFILDPTYLKDCVQELQFTMQEQIAKNPEIKKYVKPEDINKLLEFNTYLAILVKFLIKSIIIGIIVALIAKKKDRPEDSLNA